MGSDLVVTIVNRGEGEKVVRASKKAGAEGGTIMLGRGTGIHEQVKLFGFNIEPEKEIVLTLIPYDKSQAVLETIVREVQLEKPGRGIAFIIDVKAVAGISHILG